LPTLFFSHFERVGGNLTAALANTRNPAEAGFLGHLPGPEFCEAFVAIPAVSVNRAPKADAFIARIADVEIRSGVVSTAIAKMSFSDFVHLEAAFYRLFAHLADISHV
jgi:hypothetical protein